MDFSIFSQIPPASRVRTLLPRIWWHGVSSKITCNSIRRYGFRLPRSHASDPGDLGLGIYLTNNLELASHYSRGTGCVLRIRANVSNPVVLDFVHSRDDSRRWLARMTGKYGSTAMGSWKIRGKAARRWRRVLMEEGYDSVLAAGYDWPEAVTLVVFDPDSLHVVQ